MPGDPVQERRAAVQDRRTGPRSHDKCRGATLCEECAAAYLGVGVTLFQQQVRRHVSPIPIGKRRKPQPNGTPGYLRIDTVHQGDQDGRKGIYHINAVDQVTQ